MDKILPFILSRLKEPSTWAGISAVLGSAATQLDPSWGISHWFLVAAGVAGALAFGLKEQSTGK